VFLIGWYGWWRRARPRASGGRQISKRLARAHVFGPLAYGAVLGAGVLTIVSTPAVWLGLACCLLVGVPAWGSAYGVAFGAGRAFMLLLDARWSQGKPPVAVGFRIVAREADPRSRFWRFGVVSGLAVLCLALVSVVP